MSLHRFGRAAGSGALMAAAILTAGTILPAAPAWSASTGPVISEVYGGGGNSGATLTNDFIELVNLGTQPVDLSGWSVQYHSASATGTWQVTPLTGTLAPGGYFLIAEAAGTGGTQPLPTPDVTGTIPMGGSNGTVALVNASAALTCTAANCAGNASIVDLVGYGTAAIREGAAAPAASNTTSVQRATTPVDTDSNAADFAASEPTPKAPAGGGDPVPECPAEPGPVRIRDIQGTTWLSPYDGQTVTDVPGVVTAVRGAESPRGYWIQDTAPDAEPATSEGLFVYTGSGPTVAVGDAVMVDGKVKDFYTLGSGDTVANTDSISITELTNPTVAVCSSGNALPAPEVITPTSIPGVYAPRAPTGNIEDLNPVDPARSTLDFWETREGMLVQVDDARVVGPGNSYGEVYITAKPDEYASPRGGTVNTGYDKTPTGRIVVTPITGQAPPANVGDTLAGATAGPVDYSLYGGYSIVATKVGSTVDGGVERAVAEPQAEDELAVATYNVENLDPSDDPEKIARLADGIVTHLSSPDVVVLEEIQDNNGATDDAVVDADETLDVFTQAIVDAGGPRYEWRQISPTDDEDGGQPGGNIRVAFLFNPVRVSFVDRPGGDATTPTTVSPDTDGSAALSASPGRVDPTNTAWEDSRKPLAGEFVFGGEKVIVIANHFNSKGGDQSADGRFQPPVRSSEVQRLAQATAVHDFVRSIVDVDAKANVVVAGDINDYQFSPVMDALTGEILTPLITTLPENEQYSYVFNGISQTLDHILVSDALTDYEYEVVHINAEFADQASDHDPQVVRLRPETVPACTETVTGKHVGPLTVAEGVLCLDNAKQVGPVTVKEGASLLITGGTVLGQVRTDGAETVRICGSTLTGAVTVRDTTGEVVLGDAGDCTANKLTGIVTLKDNTGGVTVAGNSLVGALSCRGNEPAPENAGVPNKVLGLRTGQCAAL